MQDSAPPPGFRTIGQPVARSVVRTAAREGRMARTFLVQGPAGAGKDTFVDDVLALAFCRAEALSARPCNACEGCRRARRRGHPDLVIGSVERWRELRGTGESIVAAARRWLADAAGAPIAGELRVVLIENLDAAGEQVQNALLKALEEPGDRHCYLLVASDPALVLPTIRSRAQPLRIGPVPRDELAAWLMDELRLPADQADALARISGGLAGRAARYATQAADLDWRRRLQLELLGLLGRGRAERFAVARELLDDATRRARPASDDEPATPVDDADAVRVPTSLQRMGAAAIVEAWMGLARDLLVAAGGHPQGAATAALFPDLEATGRRIGPGPLAEVIRFLDGVAEGLAANASPRLALDAAMLRWPVAP